MIDINIQKEEKLRDEVLVVAQKLFRKYGFQKTTMEDIAKEMRKGKSTLYMVFKSKNDILAAILINESLKMNLKISAAVQAADTAGEKLKTYLLTSYELIRVSYNLDETLRDELYSSGGPVIDYKSFIANYLKNVDSERKIEFKDAGETIIKEILIFGIKNNEFNEKILDNIKYTVKAILISLTSIALGLVSESNDRYTEDDKNGLLNTSVDIMINGLKS